MYERVKNASYAVLLRESNPASKALWSCNHIMVVLIDSLILLK